MDQAAIYTELTLRNALRKAAKLPLLDLRAEMTFAIGLVAHRAYATLCENHVDDHQRIMASVLKELRCGRGADFPGSMSGRMLVGLMTDQRFRAFLEIEHGIRKPTASCRHPIRYGELRRS